MWPAQAQKVTCHTASHLSLIWLQVVAHNRFKSLILDLISVSAALCGFQGRKTYPLKAHSLIKNMHFWKLRPVILIGWNENPFISYLYYITLVTKVQILVELHLIDCDFDIYNMKMIESNFNIHDRFYVTLEFCVCLHQIQQHCICVFIVFVIGDDLMRPKCKCNFVLKWILKRCLICINTTLTTPFHPGHRQVHVDLEKTPIDALFQDNKLEHWPLGTKYNFSITFIKVVHF